MQSTLPMRKLEPVEIDPEVLRTNLHELETLLGAGDMLTERKHILPFFQARPQIIAALGFNNGDVSQPDVYATELDLFGDFVCDAASGDSTEAAFTLIEFEDAKPNSIFRARESGKSMRAWSPRFEHGFSQLVDWAWRIDAENSSAALQRVFGMAPLSIQFLLVAGRRTDLTDGDLRRLTWRAHNLRLGPFNMVCRTFDHVLSTIRRRLNAVMPQAY